MNFEFPNQFLAFDFKMFASKRGVNSNFVFWIEYYRY
jgi:hypothetical protein